MDARNAEASSEQSKKIIELEEQLNTNQDFLNKLEYLLKENLKLI